MRNKNIKVLLIGIAIFLLGWGIGKWAFPSAPERVGGVRYLIVNADDFGVSDAVTDGIIKAWQDGIVTSTSTMINMPGAPERIASAYKQYPNLAIGLHLNITEGKPVLPPDEVPTLVDKDGSFYTSDTIIEHLPDISIDELREELNAQADLMISTGVKFDHIDYHQHMLVLYSPFYSIIIEMAEKYNVPVRQPVPETIYGQIELENGGGGSADAMRRMMEFGMTHPTLAMRLMPLMSPDAYKQLSVNLSQNGVRTTNWFVDAFYGNASVTNLLAILKQLPPGVSEMMVHPGLSVDSEGYDRPQELLVLTDSQIKKALADNQIQLVDFSFLETIVKK